MAPRGAIAHRCLVVGESLVDVVSAPSGPPEMAAGGSPLNVAVGLARLGCSTRLLTEIGDDGPGRLLTGHLERSGVELGPGSVVPGRPTSTATARLDEHGTASYTFDLRWQLPPQAVPAGFDALHVGSLGATLAPGRTSVVALAQAAARSGLLVSLDPNVRPGLTPDRVAVWRGLQELLVVADVVKLSDEDLEFLHPGGAPETLAAGLLRGRTRLVVVTRGGTGAVAFSDRATVEVPSSSAQVVDTVGAGDSFMAALLAVVLDHGLDRLEATRLAAYVAAAHAAAAVTVSRRGADPPWRADLPDTWPDVR